jgi:hypothetical protein
MKDLKVVYCVGVNIVGEPVYITHILEECR